MSDLRVNDSTYSISLEQQKVGKNTLIKPYLHIKNVLMNRLTITISPATIELFLARRAKDVRTRSLRVFLIHITQKYVITISCIKLKR